ncbi:MAG: hypothetical protein OEV73_08260 [Desulfobulbaceae bacterium]|nr:hypothetical protein [Desulfobulbaceae bacterium]
MSERKNILTASNILVFLAFGFSIFSFYMSYQASQKEVVRVKKEELRHILSDLIDTSKQFRENLNSNESGQFYDLYTEKRFIYFAAAESIIEEIPTEVSWPEYNTLAKQAFIDDNYEKVISYLEKAKVNAKTTQAKVYTRNALAQAYFADTSIRDYDRARGYFKEAAIILEGIKDPYFLVLVADMYRSWATCEADAGFHEESKMLLGRSDKYLNDLPNSFPYKKEQLMEIGDLMRSDSERAKLLPNHSLRGDGPDGPRSEFKR